MNLVMFSVIRWVVVSLQNIASCVVPHLVWASWRPLSVSLWSRQLPRLPQNVPPPASWVSETPPSAAPMAPCQTTPSARGHTHATRVTKVLFQESLPYMTCCSKHSGPHLRNERTTENWAYGRFYAKLGIYQYGRERWLRSNLTSGLSSCTQVFESAWTCVQHREFRRIV